MRKAWLVVLFLLIAACHRYYSVEEVTGVLVARTYMAEDLLRWDGGKTSARYLEICNKKSGECFYGGFPDSPNWVRGMTAGVVYSKRKEIAVIIANNRNRIKREGVEFRLFLTKDGREIKCAGCNTELLQGEPASSYWNTNLEFIFSTNNIVDGSKRKSVLLIRVLGDTYTLHPLREIISSINATFHGVTQLSPDGESLAWIVCDPDCVLVESDLASGEERTQSASCPKDGYSTISWVGAEARPKCD